METVNQVNVMRRILTVDAPSICPSETVFPFHVKPDDSVKATFDKGLWWLFFGVWLDNQERVIQLFLTFGQLEFFLGLVAT